jgi:outer membrane murein-binding lipoprotein Lpp
MKATYRFVFAAMVLAVFALVGSVPTATAKWDSYHNALGHLRAARALIEHPDSGELHDQERNAIAEIDQALAEVKSVADDGKSLEDHPGADLHARWIPRLNKAVEQLNKAHDDVTKEDDQSGARERAVQHIGQARKLITQAIALEQ